MTADGERLARLEARFDAGEEAVRLLRETMTDRLESINEFRGQLRDQAGTFVTRELVDEAFRRLEQADQAQRAALGVDIQRLADAQAILGAAIGELRTELAGQRARSAAYLTALGIGLTVLGVALRYV